MKHASIYPQSPIFDAPSREVPGGLSSPSGTSKAKSRRSRNFSSTTVHAGYLGVQSSSNDSTSEAPRVPPPPPLTTSQSQTAAASSRPKVASRSMRPRMSEPLPVITLEALNLGEDSVDPRNFNASGSGKGKGKAPHFSEPFLTLEELGLGLDAVNTRGLGMSARGKGEGKGKAQASLPTPASAPGGKRSHSHSELGMPTPSSGDSKSAENPAPGEEEEEIIRIPDSAAAEDSEHEDIAMTSEQTTNSLVELSQTGSHPDGLPTFVEMDKARVQGFKGHVRLLEHQVRAREWMRLREDPGGNKWGGILADEMGLGKTVQTLVRILDRIGENNGKGILMPNLIVCPLSILSQWKDEIERLVSPSRRLKVVTYYGPSRRCSIYDMIKHDVVLTTYGVVKSEHLIYQNSTDDLHASNFIDSKSNKFVPDKKNRRITVEKPGDMLFRVKWSCVVLDEAHEIRNAETKKAKACHDLPATFRWCLTGTPFQNRASDLYSLCKFLRLKTYSDPTWFEENITHPIKTGVGAKRALNLLHIVFSRVMLRRMKNEKGPTGQVLLPLPEYKLKLVNVTLQDFEREIYDAIDSRFNSVLSAVLLRYTGIQLYACVWVLLLRLRQACLHPSLIAPKYNAEAKEVQGRTKAKGAEEEVDDEVEDEVEYTEKNCPLCGMNLTTLDKRDTEAHLSKCGEALRLTETFSENPPPSAKIIAMLNIPKQIKRRPGNEKTIVYSQFTSMLGKIKPFLTEAGFKYVTFDGSMNGAQRAKSLKMIREDVETTVILVSLMAGGVGLNLIDCNNVILIDLWWNPAVEEQAFARVHRMGQKKLVHIYKLVAEKTVEGRILTLQEKKKALANATLDRNEISNVKKLTKEDILMLLRRDRRRTSRNNEAF